MTFQMICAAIFYLFFPQPKEPLLPLFCQPEFDFNPRKHVNELPDNSDEDARDRLFSDFVSFVNRLILLRNGNRPIRKFELFLLAVEERFRVAFDSLISAALSSKLQELKIFVDYNRGHYSPRLSPEEVNFTCNTLTC